MGRDDRTGDLFADSRKTGGASVRPIADASRPSEPRAKQSPPLPTRASAAAVGPEECKVIRFPASVWAPRLWAGKVEIAAQTLIDRKTERGRSNYWARLVDTLAAQMLRRGATEVELDDQLDAFREAVQAALSSGQAVSRDDHQPPGAA